PRHAGLAANQHDFIDLAGVNARIFHALLARPNRLLNDVFDHAFQLRPGQLLHQVLRSAGVSGDEGQVHFSLHRRGELDFGALSCVTQALQRHLVALTAQVKSFIFAELVNQPVDNSLIDVVTAQVSITIGSFDFDYALANLKNRNIEGATAEVVHSDSLVSLLVETVGQSRCRRLVDDSLHIETGDL